MKDALESMVWQFAHRTTVNERIALSAGGLSAMEEAFEALGWSDPHILSDEESNAVSCDVAGCFKPSCCGLNWGKFYLRLCQDHSRESGNNPCPPIKQHALAREARRGADGVLRR